MSSAHTDPPTVTFDVRGEAERALALEIRALVREKPTAVIGLATGGTMTGVYAELARMVRAREVSFARAVTFNLDEYLGLAADHAASMRSRMQSELFAHVDLPPKSRHFPDVDDKDVEAAARDYEARIRGVGGIDLQILGIGRNGHIAFNEPGSTRDSRTRTVDLDATTRADAASAFGSLDAVPRRALTMGVATILDARRLRVLAFGAHKAAIVRAALVDPESSAVPASFLRGHPDARLYLDRAGASMISARPADS